MGIKSAQKFLAWAIGMLMIGYHITKRLLKAAKDDFDAMPVVVQLGLAFQHVMVANIAVKNETFGAAHDRRLTSINNAIVCLQEAKRLMKAWSPTKASRGLEVQLAAQHEQLSKTLKNCVKFKNDQDTFALMIDELEEVVTIFFMLYKAYLPTRED